MLREPELFELTRQVNGLSRTTDNLLSTIAARQHGRVATWQLAACSISDDEIRSRVASHRLHRVELGVYAVGHPGAGPEAARMAASSGRVRGGCFLTGRSPITSRCSMGGVLDASTSPSPEPAGPTGREPGCTSLGA